MIHIIWKSSSMLSFAKEILIKVIKQFKKKKRKFIPENLHNSCRDIYE